MKIEIGESLIRSWLRHVESCELAELNWKPSPIWEKQNHQMVERYYQEALAIWPEAFGQNSLSQLLKQSEVDVLGLSYNQNKTKVHFVDIAFHSGGLIYGSKETTSKRIFKKLVRSALVSLSYFPDSSSTVYFVSPVVSPAMENAVTEACEKAQSLFKDHEWLKFKLILNNSFNSEVLNEVLNLGNEVADTSELFLRSWQLLKPFQKESTSRNRVDTSSEINESVERYKVLTTAFYLSKFGHQYLNLGNQGDTIQTLANQLGVSAGSLRGYRDRFDRYVEESPRVGWEQPLSDELSKVLERFSKYTESELREIL